LLNLGFSALGAMASLGGLTAPGDTIQRGGGWHPNEIYFLWLNLERTLDKRRWKIGVTRWQLKKVITLYRAMT